MTYELLEPRGFCAGVAGAIRKALAIRERPVYCLHELVHNERVVADLRARDFVFVETLAEVPAGATVLFSAHGVAPRIRQEAAARNLKVVDATCPFVTRVHEQARAFAARGLPVVVLGDARHDEVRGILGEVAQATVYPELPAAPRIGVVSQTTLNADDVEALLAKLRTRYEVETSAAVCRATKDRQDAVKRFKGDALLVLGSPNSSNTRRLAEVAVCRAFRAGTLEEVRALDLRGVRHLGVTAGASTPSTFVDEVVAYLDSQL
mgnify:FL=1